MHKIPFNKPHLIGKELENINRAVLNGHISGNGKFTERCHLWFKNKYGFRKCLLTTSCTDALEMAALLININPGDEIIMPSFTFVSTALAFVRQGAKIVFADSRNDHPGIDEGSIERLITPRTRAVVVVHYAGVACNMNVIVETANKHNLIVIEDAAQAIDSYYLKKPLGGIGHLGCLSFHETKNIQCGEGGMIIINDEKFEKRSEILWEKGTNRTAFRRGEVDKYGWVDIGSSFLPSELNSAFLYAQLKSIKSIQQKRLIQWGKYFEALKNLENKGYLRLPYIPDYATHNGHIFYVILNNKKEKENLLKYLNNRGVLSVFHYLPLHLSEYYYSKHDGRILPNAVMYSEELIRLPLFFELNSKEQSFIIDLIYKYFKR